MVDHGQHATATGDTKEWEDADAEPSVPPRESKPDTEIERYGKYHYLHNGEDFPVLKLAVRHLYNEMKWIGFFPGTKISYWGLFSLEKKFKS